MMPIVNGGLEIIAMTDSISMIISQSICQKDFRPRPSRAHEIPRQVVGFSAIAKVRAQEDSRHIQRFGNAKFNDCSRIQIRSVKICYQCITLDEFRQIRVADIDCVLDCFIADEDVAAEAKRRGVTRARVSMEKAARLGEPVIFAIGNAPTALIRIRELMDAGELQPKLVIGVPVGFVNVVASKELIIESGAPCIVARGRKGGSNVAACIVNALLYILDETRGQ